MIDSSYKTSRISKGHNSRGWYNVGIYLGVVLRRTDDGECNRTSLTGPRTRPKRLSTQVYRRVFDALATESRPAHYMGKPDLALSALRNCALVCREWYHLTWYHLRRRIQLRHRDDVLKLHRLLRARPRLRSVPEQVVIRGCTTSPADRAPIPHLETFATMLSGRLSSVSVFYIRDAILTTGPVQSKGVRHLAAFSSVETLVLSNVTITRLAQLTLLISSLPQLEVLSLEAVDCLEEQMSSWVLVPSNCIKLQKLHMLHVAVTIEEFFIRLSQTCSISSLVYLAHEVKVKMHHAPQLGGCQRLLDANSSSLQVLQLLTGNTHTVTNCSEDGAGKSLLL